MKITLEKNQRIFFTSDTHYNHSNICSATTNWSVNDGYARTFNSLEHMNTTIVNNINNMVGEDDILIHLGDWLTIDLAELRNEDATAIPAIIFLKNELSKI